MARPRPLSGFPEWLPQGRAVERHVLATLTRVFELHGFVEIETRAVEPLDQLLRKGETSKEVYVLRRLQDMDQAGAQPLGLHFDLTVPLARYVLQNAGQLDFPFKRFQIQKVWRGERPQAGRFREFAQADIDVIGRGELAFHHELELPLVMAEALAALDVGRFKVLANNRKLAQGFAVGIGVQDLDVALRWIDKLDKIGAEAARVGLIADGVEAEQADLLLRFAGISTDDADRLAAAVGALAAEARVARAVLEEGLGELVELLRLAGERLPGVVVADLKIVRGLDYYTGSVYETVWLGHESLGSVCSGGRYDSLASDGASTYPGVGLSIGVTRLVSRILAEGLLAPTRRSPAAALVAVADESRRPAANRVAAALRARGIPTEVAPAAGKYRKQIKYADERGIPHVWFPADGEAEPDGIVRRELLGEVKDLRTRDQTPADAATWRPPDEDLAVRVVRPAPSNG
ncbi:MAG: histidine--tRNA ligase [Bifidobacteriaceae bacterium]|jgi:histidyl-tRNA synthetase|nr:histidine--tRNA ligase [Bifidobacteriaceae bacterium]